MQPMSRSTNRHNAGRLISDIAIDISIQETLRRLMIIIDSIRFIKGKKNTNRFTIIVTVLMCWSGRRNVDQSRARITPNIASIDLFSDEFRKKKYKFNLSDFYRSSSSNATHLNQNQIKSLKHTKISKIVLKSKITSSSAIDRDMIWDHRSVRRSVTNAHHNVVVEQHLFFSPKYT